MKKIKHILTAVYALGLLMPLMAFQMSFSLDPTPFEVSSYGAVEFGDFDADGDLDFFVFGEGNSNIGIIYINTASGFTVDSAIVLPIGARIVDAKWADVDNDGDLDIFVTGNNFGRFSRLLRNDGGSFTEENYNFEGLEDGAMDWADVDNDGDLDLAYTGRNSSFNRPLKLVINQGAGFDNAVLSVDGVEKGDIEWGDFDGDGDQDLFVTGYGDNGRQAAIFEQDQGVFTKVPLSVKAMTRSASDWGDYDGDGDQDLLICGSWNDGTKENRLTLVYRNDNGSFTELNAGLTGVDNGDVKWADFDNDGDLDILMSGDNGNEVITKIYRNDGTGFTDNGIFFQGVKNSALAVGDYDGDGDVDVLVSGWDGTNRYTKLYTNTVGVINNAPNYPVTNTAEQNGGSWRLSWGFGGDDATISDGLTYNLRVGTSPSSDDILSSHTVPFSGKYMLARKGNMGSQRFRVLNGLQEGTYYWSVQAVDNSFITSGFSPPQSFTVSGQPKVQVYYPNGGENLSAGSTVYIKFYTNYLGNFRVDYSSDAGVSWMRIRDTAQVQDTVYMKWTTPNVASDQYLIRVSDRDNSNISDISNGLFSIRSDAYLEILSPNGGESFLAGDTTSIEWSASAVNNVNIFFSSDNGANWSEVISFYPAGTGQYVWSVPEVSSSECLVLIEDSDNAAIQDMSNGVFSVSPAAGVVLSLISPQRGDYWEMGSSQTVRWTVSDPSLTSLKIELSGDNGLNYTELAQVADPNVGEYTVTVPVMAPTGQALLRISDNANTAIFDETDGNFSVGDSTAPGITNFDIPSQVLINSDLSVRIALSDISGMGEVYLFARRGGDAQFQSVMMNDDGTAYSATIPASQITDRGITFYVGFDDIYGNWDQTTWQSVPVVVSGGLNNPVPPVAGSAVTDYRLFSIPGILKNNSATGFLTNNPDLGDYDPTRFRWYGYDNGTQMLREYPDFGLLNPGRGFFLITAQDITMNSGEANTASTAKPFRMNVPAGFTLIGNPFNFRIPFDSLRVTTPNATFRLWEFNGDWVQNSSGMSPWKGYALWVSTATTFVISPGKDTFSKAQNIYVANKETDEWLLRVNARDSGSRSSFHRIGQLEKAGEAHETYNPEAPPRLPGAVRIRFEDGRSANDIREVSTEGQIFTFTVEVNPDEEVTTLWFEDLEQLPSGFDAFLYDQESGSVYNIADNPEITFVSKGEERHAFKLAVGQPDYIESAAPEITIYPARFGLRANYPNPFNPATTIRYALAGESPVELTVYNTLGERVATLVNTVQEAGDYSLVWRADALSSGVYLIRLKAGHRQFIQRALLIK